MAKATKTVNQFFYDLFLSFLLLQIEAGSKFEERKNYCRVLSATSPLQALIFYDLRRKIFTFKIECLKLYYCLFLVRSYLLIEMISFWKGHKSVQLLQDIVSHKWNRQKQAHSYIGTY